MRQFTLKVKQNELSKTPYNHGSVPCHDVKIITYIVAWNMTGIPECPCQSKKVCSKSAHTLIHSDTHAAWKIKFRMAAAFPSLLPTVQIEQFEALSFPHSPPSADALYKISRPKKTPFTLPELGIIRLVTTSSAR